MMELGVFILLLFLLLLRVGAFQDYLGKKIIKSLGTEWSERIHISELSIHDLSHIHFFDVLLNEPNGDTAAYIHELKIRVGELDFLKNQYVIKKILINNALINLSKRSAEEKYNFQLLFEKKNIKAQNQLEFNVFFEEVDLNNCVFNHQINNEKLNSESFDYQYFKCNKLNGLFNNVLIADRGIFFPDNQLSFTLNDTLKIVELSSQFKFENNRVSLKNTAIKTEDSKLHTVNLTYNLNTSDSSQFIYQMDSVMGNISFTDLVHFYQVPVLIDSFVNFSANIAGNKSLFSIDDFIIYTGTSKPLIGNLSFERNFIDFSSSFLHFDLSSGSVNKENLTRILLNRNGEFNTIEFPSSLDRIKQIDLVLNLEGTLNQLDSRLSLNSNLGEINGIINVDVLNQFFEGDLKIKDLSGHLFSVDDGINDFDGNLKFKGKGFNTEQIDLEVDGEISNFNYNGYNYDKIVINGHFLNESFNGFLALRDPNINASFNGLFDFNQWPTRYNFSIDVNSINPNALKWTNELENMSLSFSSDFSGFGLNLDDFLGNILIEDISIDHKNESVQLSDISVLSKGNNKIKQIYLQSDILIASIEGNIEFKNLLEDFIFMTSIYAPNLIGSTTFDHDQFKHDYHIKVEINEFDDFSSLFIPDLSISKGSSLEFTFNRKDTLFSFLTESKEIRIGQYFFNDIEIVGERKNNPSHILLNTEIGNIIFSNTFNFQQVSLGLNMKENMLNSNLSYLADDSVNYGEITMESIIKSRDEFNTIINTLKLSSKENGSWEMKEISNILFQQNSFRFNNFSVSNLHQMLSLNGVVGPHETDELSISLSEFDLSNLVDLTKNEELQLDLSGVINLDLNLKSILNDIDFTGSVLVNQLKLNEFPIGDLSFRSQWESKENRFNIEGGLRNENRIEEIEFQSIKYYPFSQTKDQLEGAIHFEDFNIDFLNPFLPKPYIGNLESNLTGKVFLSGSIVNPAFNGELKLNDSRIDLVQHQTSYLVNGGLSIKPTQIELVDAIINDKYHNKASIYASYEHEGFKKYSYNIISEFNEPFLVMNNSFDENPLYYGDAFVTGFSTISYDSINDLAFNIHVRTEENSVLTIPLYGNEDVVLEDFITFEQKEISNNSEEEKKVNTDLDFNLNMDIEVTDDAEIQVVFDQMVGDVMKSRGNGDLRFFIDETLDFNLFGNYEVSSGEYLFTLKDFINKKFNVKPGGTITWFGDPYNAKLDLNAYYPLKTSLYNIMPSVERENWTHKSNVHVDIHLQNDLMNPDIDFDISLPKAEESAKQTVQNLIYNEEVKNQQVFSLLILNKFIPENQNFISENSSKTNGATTSEVLSNQLGNMISSFSDEFEIGFNYSPGDSITDDELSIVMSTQQFNDRLLINTNLGVAPSHALNKDPNSFIGDVDLEYKLSRDGNLRLHAFNESNEYDLSNQNQSRYTQGVGAYYKQSFDSFGELFCEMTNFFRRKNKKCDKCDEPKSIRECP